MAAVASSAGFARPVGWHAVLIAAAALLAGAADCLLVLGSDHFTDRAVYAVLGPVVGGASSAPALRLAAAAGFPLRRAAVAARLRVVPLPAPGAAEPLLFTLGISLGALWGPLLAHVLLSFPGGRLATRRQRALVVAGYVLVPLAPVPALLVSESDDVIECDGPCPRNLLLIERDAALGESAARRRARSCCWSSCWRSSGCSSPDGGPPARRSGAASRRCSPPALSRCCSWSPTPPRRRRR